MIATGGNARCRLCGASSVALFSTTDRNRHVSRERFHYNRCSGCGAIFLTDVPDDLGSYYPEEYYGLPSRERLAWLSALESYKLDLVQRHVRGGRLVEVGPGLGSFALAAKRAGFEVCCIEMDARCCEHLSSVVGVEAIQADDPAAVFAELPASRAIMLSHVLEHLPEPWRCLDAAARNLESGGALFVSMPNPHALQFRVQRSRWPHIDAPRHLHLIPSGVLVDRAARLGLGCALLTTDDEGGRRQNKFGWGHFLIRPGSGLKPRVGGIIGAVTAFVLAPIERRGLNGATYTAVFRKNASRAS